MIGKKPKCTSCGSNDVVMDAQACWDGSEARWTLDSVRDDAYCRNCGASGRFVLEWEDDETAVAKDEDKEDAVVGTAMATAEALPPLPASSIKSRAEAVMSRMAELPKTDERMLSTFSEPEWDDVKGWWDEFIDEARAITGKKRDEVVGEDD